MVELQVIFIFFFMLLDIFQICWNEYILLLYFDLREASTASFHNQRTIF